MVSVFWRLLGSAAASGFFALLFHAPRRSILPASLVAMVGYGVYLLGEALTGSVVAGNFLGAMAIAALGEGLARKMRMPATIFVSIGVLPLVPGLGLYQTMLNLVQNKLGAGARAGLETLMVAGAIAMGIALVSPFFSIFHGRNKAGMGKQAQ